MPTAISTPETSAGTVTKGTPVISGKHLESLQRDGFVVVRNLISINELEALRHACQHITSLARHNGWPYVRTVPKQYPPWPLNTDGLNIWGVQHLLHPEMPNRTVFAELYFNDKVIDMVKELVGLGNRENGDDLLVMELFNLLISPGSSTDFELCWHRDDIKPNITPEEEQRELDEKSPRTGSQFHAQYNIALYDDSSLIAVPGSHRRIRTEVEREAAPYEAVLPGQVKVDLAAGDAVFYNSNILHRGVYRGIDETRTIGRMTLHGSVGLAGHGNERARQVLQHAVGQWIDQDTEPSFGLKGNLARRAEAMRTKLIALGEGENLGYSLDG